MNYFRIAFPSAVRLVACLLVSFSSVWAQEPSPTVTDTAPVVEIDQDAPGTPPKERQRIVDPKKYPKKTFFPARVLLAPFRGLAPRIDSRLTQFEQANGLYRLQLLLSGREKWFTPIVGGLGDGAGFAPGVRITSGNRLSEQLQLSLQAQYSTRRYLDTRFNIAYKPSAENFRFLTVTVGSRYRIRPEEDFWGIGPFSSRGNRSTYNQVERGVGVNVVAKLPGKFRVGAGIDYSSSSIFNGKDRRFADTKKLFGGTGLAGLDRGATLLGYGGFVEFDGRDHPSAPRAGAYATYSVTSFDGLREWDFGFVKQTFDTRFYIPLGTKRRVLALRGLGNFNSEKGGSAIPFFQLARLGDQNTLRGFDTYRYHDKNALMGSAEYRYQVLKGIELLAFTDIGQVFDDRIALSRRNARATMGGGIQFATSKRTVFKALFAQSPEGVRIFLNVGPTF